MSRGRYSIPTSTMPRETANVRRFADADGLGLAVPASPAPSRGHSIVDARSGSLISGVQVEELRYFPDDRGFFSELARFGLGPARHLAGPGAEPQVSFCLSYPGTIKAFHYHARQTDLWCMVLGMFQVALHDLRLGSSTFGRTNTLFAGELRPAQIVIPPGVAHGYKVVGDRPGILVYLTDRFYDVTDEGRLAFDDPNIAYDWKTQFK